MQNRIFSSVRDPQTIEFPLYLLKWLGTWLCTTTPMNSKNLVLEVVEGSNLEFTFFMVVTVRVLMMLVTLAGQKLEIPGSIPLVRAGHIYI